MTEYFFVRHAECKKNLERIMGGPGMSLTETGARQARHLADELALMTHRPAIVACPAVQAIETAEVIAAMLKCDVSVDGLLIPAGMGLVSGLAADEIERRYPKYAHELERWRNLEIEACELKIPGIEPPEEFWSRSVSALRAHKVHDQVIVVATRSIMVLAANLSMGHGPEPGGGYKHVVVGYCQIVTVRL